MKSKTIFFACLAVLLFSQCTGQRFTFREKVKVQKHELAVAKHKPVMIKKDTSVEIALEEQITESIYASNEDSISQIILPATQTWIKTQTTLKTVSHFYKKESTPKVDDKKDNSWAAQIGFLCVVISLFLLCLIMVFVIIHEWSLFGGRFLFDKRLLSILPIMYVLLNFAGLAFSIGGLKSAKKKFAVGGLMLSIPILLLLALMTLTEPFNIMFWAFWGVLLLALLLGYIIYK